MTPLADVATKALLPALADPAALGRDFERDGSTYLDSFVALEIRDVNGLEVATLERTHIGETLAKIDAFFEPLTSMAFKLHRALTARRNAVRQPWERADALFSTAMTRFKAAQDKIRRLEEQALATEHRLQEEARAAVEAATLERAGEPELAEAVVAQAIAAPAPVVTLPDVTKGIAKFRDVWKWKYLGDSQEHAMRLIPREYLQPNTVAISKVVTALKDQTKIPGIIVWKDQVPVR